MDNNTNEENVNTKELNNDNKEPQVENVENNNKNKSKLLIVIIIILSIILCYSIGYIIGTKLGNSDNKKEEKNPIDNTTEKTSEVENYSDLRGYEDRIRENLSTKSKELEDKIYLLKELAPLNKVTDLSNKQLQKIIKPMPGETAIIVDQRVKSLFGDAIRLKHEDVICNIDNTPFYIFDNNLQKYVDAIEYNHAHGWETTQRIYLIYEDVIENKDNVIVKTKIFYGDPMNELFIPNSNFYALPNRENLLYTDDYPEKVVEEEVYNKIKDKLPQTTFTFSKESDGNLVLVSIINE